ncbi:1006_t:CDS:1, partial [Scutellospora calospora]
MEDKKEIIASNITETINIEDKKQSNETKIILSDEYTTEIINIENINIPLKVKKSSLSDLNNLLNHKIDTEINSYSKEKKFHNNVIDSW